MRDIEGEDGDRERGREKEQEKQSDVKGATPSLSFFFHLLPQREAAC